MAFAIAALLGFRGQGTFEENVRVRCRASGQRVLKAAESVLQVVAPFCFRTPPKIKSYRSFLIRGDIGIFLLYVFIYVLLGGGGFLSN